jgi:serine/threonine protein kinase
LLSDFGIAQVVQSSRTQSRQEVAGTIVYMAPEQIQDQSCPASDQYALGVVLYEWLTGTPPFHGSFREMAAQHTLAPPQPLHEKILTIAPAVEDIVLKALAKDPKDRFESVQAFADALEHATKAKSLTPSIYPTQQQLALSQPVEKVSQSGRSLGATSQEILPKGSRGILRRRVLIGLVGVVVGSGMALLAYSLENRSVGTPTYRLVYQDSLDDSTNSSTTDTNWQRDSGYCFFRTDGYHVKSTDGYPYFCTEMENLYKNFDITVDMSLVSGYSAGLLFRVQDNNDCYFFEVNSGYKISILRNGGQQAQTLQDWSPFSRDNLDPHAMLTLRVTAYSNNFTFYINNIYQTRVTDPSSSYASGGIGFVCHTDAGSSGEAIFSNLKVYLYD